MEIPLNTLRDAINSKDFVVTAELPLWPPRSRQVLESELRSLAPVADAVHLGVDDRADSGVAPLAVASIALQEGLDPVLHIHGRDQNRIALQSELIGAVTIGVSSIVLRRGEKLPSALRGRVKGVFDTKTTQLISIAKRISERAELGGSQELYIGCMTPPMRPSDDWEAALIKEKLDNGASFLQTRPIFSDDFIRAYGAGLVSHRLTHRASVLVGIPLLTSLSSARNIADRFPSTKTPEPMLQRLSEANDARAEGIAILADRLNVAADTPGIAGAAIVNVDDIDAVVEAVKLAGLEN